jgi:WD40 repeat protein
VQRLRLPERGRWRRRGRRLSSESSGGGNPGSAGEGGHYRVDARGAEGLLVGDQGTQINYFFYRGTWTDGVAAAPLVSMSGSVAAPYRGLSAFGERDAALFFGRESEASDVLAVMSRRLEGTSLAVVSGVSGAGKSSLVNAGVLPRLRGAGLGAAPEAASWPCLVFTPGSRPLEELAVRIAPLAGAEAAAVRRELAADPVGFALTARQAAHARPVAALGGGWSDAPGQRRVLLVVDQFEQLFTQCESEDERLAFIAALGAAAGASGSDRQRPAALVVIVVRADFEARLADYSMLIPAVQDRYLLTAMTERQLRMAITRPAVAAGSSVESDLVETLLDEVRSRSGGLGPVPGRTIGSGVLPLLSHALDQAWRRRTSQALTLSDYERTGGIEGAVAASAQRAYDRLTPARQATARQVFTRLTATTAEGVDTAVRAARVDLTTGRDDAQVRDVEAVLETFAGERLITLAAGTVEISHEALLTAWPLLRDTWLAETHADRVLRTRLLAAAEEWERDGRDPSYLYSGSRLETAVETAARISADTRQVTLGRTEADFLSHSRRVSRRRAWRRRGFIAVLLALVAGLAAITVATVHASQETARQRDIATRQRNIAISGELAADSEGAVDSDATASRLESIAAWGIYPSSQARYAMLADAASPQIVTLTASSDEVTSVAFSPDGKTLATGGSDGTARLWNLASDRQIASLATSHSKGITSVAFSPNGEMLATGDNDDAVQLFSVTTGKQLLTFSVPGAVGVNSVAFSPDGTTLATGSSGSADGLNLFAVATGRLVASFSTAGAVESVAFSPDGTTLATGGDTGTQLFNVATGRETASFPLPTNSYEVNSVAFSPDGKTLAISGAGTQLWNLVTGRKTASFSDAFIVVSAAFSPDGKTLATGDSSGAALWSLATRQQISSTLTGFGLVNSVVFSPDGKTLATGDNSGKVRLWNLTSGRQTAGISVGSNGVDSVAFSPDSKTLATGAVPGGTAQLWNLATGRQTASLPAGYQDVQSVAFSPDGETLVTAGDNGTQLWNVATGGLVHNLSVDDVEDGNVAAFSPDGKMIANGGPGTVQLFNAATGQQIADLSTGGVLIDSIAFSPNGKILATGGPILKLSPYSGGTVQLWNLATRRKVATFSTNSYEVTSLAFSPDSTTLATSGDSEAVQLWNVATSQQVASFSTGSDQVNSVAFSPDGTTLATGGENDTVQLWNLPTRQQVGSTLTIGSGLVESVEFSPNGQMLAVGAIGTVQLWQVSYLLDPLARICAQIGGSLTRAEWTKYVPSGPPYRNVCAGNS